jgi:hypothetical protein
LGWRGRIMAIVRTVHGIKYNWESGQAGWGTDVNNNFLRLGLTSNLGVISMAITIPPVSPTAGDAYIVAGGGTAEWDGEDGNLAVWDYEVGAVVRSWIIYEPEAGWLVFNLDNNTLFAHNGTAWSTDGPTFTFA